MSVGKYFRCWSGSGARTSSHISAAIKSASSKSENYTGTLHQPGPRGHNPYDNHLPMKNQCLPKCGQLSAKYPFDVTSHD